MITTEKDQATNRTVKTFNNFKSYKTILGDDQLYLTISVRGIAQNTSTLAAKIYDHISSQLCNAGFVILHERIFCSLDCRDKVLDEREKVYQTYNYNLNSPFTLIQGHPIFGKGLAGIQIRAFKPSKGDKVETVFEDNKAVGRTWTRKGATFFMFQNIFGNSFLGDRYQETCDMFDRAQNLLQRYGMSFKNVLRTWIYLSRILDWYNEFNKARNARFTGFGLVGQSKHEHHKAEEIYLPASTGILGENIAGACGTMDILALPLHQKNISIVQTSGMQQKSPFRYGSAFSRAMTLKESDVTHILLSGTASIDEHGKTVFVDDAAGQIRKTFEVVHSLIRQEGATLEHINEATIFFKYADDYAAYLEIIDEFSVKDFPAVFVVADVCRDDLLFEIDAAIAI